MELRVALAQINPRVGDLGGNARRAEEHARRAQDLRCDLVLFPEMALTGYPPEDLLLKSHFVEANLNALKRLASRIRDITAVIGFVDQDRNGHCFNAAAVLHDGEVKGVYHKQALPNYGVFDEQRYFHPGSGSAFLQIHQCRIGLTICEDIWIDDSPALRDLKSQAHILVNLSSSPYSADKVRLREDLLRRRAREHDCAVAYVNLVGGQDALVFDGNSLVLDEQGAVLARGAHCREDLVAVDLSLRGKNLTPPGEDRGRRLIAVPGKPPAGRPALSVHPAAPDPARGKDAVIDEIFQVLCLGTADYVNKNGFQRVLVGLSGGIDSAVVAVVAARALGPERVVAVSMPSRFSSKGTREDAASLARNLKIEFHEIPIEGTMTAYDDMLKPVFDDLPRDVTEENIQARIRGNILMAMSNKFGWMVLATGNKSELAVGYCTLYGDMSGGFAVLKDVLKTRVYELARRINKTQGGVIPGSITTRAPSAELREGQTDQDALPEYELLDEIVKGYVEEHLSADQLSLRHPAETVNRVIGLIDRNEYKRRQAAPGVKITPRAFGKDWRLPITNGYSGEANGC